MNQNPKPGLSALRYTTLRLALFLGWGGVLYLVGVRGIFLALIAFGGSGIMSLFVLQRQRDDMSAGLASVFGRINKRIEDSKKSEDFD